MLKTKVKVSKITNLSEARYCAGMGVDYLSFPTSSVDLKSYQEITGWVAGPKFGIEMDGDENNLFQTDFFEITTGQLNKIPASAKAFVTISVNEWFEKKPELISSKEKILAIELKINSIEDSKKIIQEIEKEFEVYIKLDSNHHLESILDLPIVGISLLI